jgi:hypothetical protein
MARHRAHLTGTVVALVLVVATVIGLVYAAEARYGHRKSSAIPIDQSRLPGETALVCLVLAGGAAVFASIVCAREVSRMLA